MTACIDQAPLCYNIRSTLDRSSLCAAMMEYGMGMFG